MPAWTPAPYALPYIAANDVIEQTPATNQEQMKKVSEYLAQVASSTPIGTVIPWGLPYDEVGGAPYSNVNKNAPFHLPCTGGVYETSVAPVLADAIGHTFAPFAGGRWATVDAAGNGLEPNHPDGEIVAFWEEADLQGPFPHEPVYNLGAALPWAGTFALCFFGQWTNARVVQYKWEGGAWSWHFFAGDGDITEVLDHEVVGGEYMPKMYNGKTGPRTPMKAYNASTNALEDVDETGVYEFEFEPGGANTRQWHVITHDGFVVPDFRGRSPVGQHYVDDPVVGYATTLGHRQGDWRTKAHSHVVIPNQYSNSSAGGTVRNPGTPNEWNEFSGEPMVTQNTNSNGNSLAHGVRRTNITEAQGTGPDDSNLTMVAYHHSVYINEMYAAHGASHHQPQTIMNFLIFAGGQIIDPTPLNDTRTRSSDVHRVHPVTASKMLFQQLADPHLSDEERKMLEEQLTSGLA